jgi:LCP family protein required for cell wall assembly
MLIPLALASRSSLPLLGSVQPLTVLVLGVDQRAEESGPTRSDAMLLAGSAGPDAGRAAILSIPRDLWVEIPGVGEQRINTALFFGYEADDPTAGPRLAVQTVASQLGVPIDRYLVLDFQTFVRLIDALGGVEVDVPQPITDPEYPTPDYGVTTIHFDAGLQILDGERALIYVRTRHADSDFGRSERQQQVLQAMAAKLVQPSTWPRLPEAYRVLRDGVITDATPEDAPALLPLVQAIAEGELMTATLGEDLATPWVTPAGAWVLLPNWPAIDGLVNELFGSRP